VELPSCAATVKVGMLKTVTFVALHDNISSFLLSSKEDFLMQLTLNTHKSNTATCPHGLPIGSCPICNGMSGGGMRKADFSAKPGEMSWNECAAIGAFLKAQKLASQTRVQDAQNFAQKLADFQKGVNVVHAQITALNKALSTKLPQIISTPLTFVLRTVLQRPLEVLRAVPQVFTNTAQKLADIGAKINSVLGEIKTALQKQVSENLSSLKKKIKTLFAIFETLNLENEDKKVEEDKRIFDLKKFLHKLKRKQNETP